MSDKTAETGTKKLAAHLADTRYADIPAHVIDLAKFKTLDMVGCFVYGIVLPAAAPAATVATRMGGTSEATIVRQAQRVPAALAAMANGTASHCFEMDDRQPESALHPGSAMVPAGLAVAEARHLSGAAYLAALTLGHDVGCRVGASIATDGTKRTGFHGMGSWASIGAAAVAARAIGLDAVRSEQVLGVSSATAFAMDFVSAGEAAKGYHAGKAAMGGVLAAELVEAGLKGPSDFLEDRVAGAERSHPGYLSLLSTRPNIERLTRDLGVRYELELTGTKRYAGDGCMQAGIEALRDLVREHQIRAGEVDKINVYSMTHVKEENTYVEPSRPIEALFSYPHVLAVALIDGDVTPSIVLPEMLQRPDLRAIRHKVELFVDPEYDKMWPGGRPARIEIVTSRGTFRKEVRYSKGTAENPMTWDEQVEKFMLLAEDGLGSDGAKRVVDKIWALDTVGDVNELTQLLRP